METLLLNDFRAGWVPGDDPVNGRKNGLLRMNSVTLDSEGALSLGLGTSNFDATNYPADAHTMYARFLSGAQYKYLALTDGAVYRGNTALTAGAGSTTRAAFGSAYNYNFIASGNYRVKDTGAAVSNLGLTGPTAASLTVISAGAGDLFGSYQYAFIIVANFNGAYLAKSAFSLITEIVLSNENATVTVPADPSTYDAQANEVWIYRRGGNLEQWYRVKRLTASWTTPFTDDFPDLDALELNEVGNSYSLPVNSAGLADPILEMVGLINGRMLYFTKNGIVISERFSPDSYDTRRVMYYSGNGTTGSELFLWARQVGESTVLIGTTLNRYVLSGTFSAAPDGTLDVYLRPLGGDNPPIGIGAAVFGNSVVYMAADGWRISDINGNVELLCPPILDRLYKGETLIGYAGVSIIAYPTYNYHCVVSRNKLYALVPLIGGGTRLEIYDFVRKYWRPSTISPVIIARMDDDAVMGQFNVSGTRNLRFVEDYATKTLNGTNQAIDVWTLFQDNGNPRNKKDGLTIQLRIDTGGSNISLICYKDNDLNTALTISTTVSSNGLSELSFALNAIVGTFKNLSFRLTGSPANFRLTDISVNYEPHPNPTQRYVHLRHSFGEIDGSKKKVSTWPIVIDTYGQDFNFTPSIDGTEKSASIINTSGKRVHLHRFAEDLFGTDYSFRIDPAVGVKLCEVWDILNPEVTQTLPLGKRIDSIGPIHLFKFGRIKKIQVRLISFTTGNVPYILYVNETSQRTGNIAVVANAEDIYDIDLPKTSGGDVVRLVLGPTAFDFHRFYALLGVDKKGNDEISWVNLTMNELS